MKKTKVAMPEVKELRRQTLDRARRITAKYVYINKENHAICEKCGHEFEVGKTKHKGEIVCPHCKSKMEIVHDWRRKNEERVDWAVTGEAIDNNRFMLRYVVCRRRDMKVAQLEEKARLVLDFNKRKEYPYEKVWGGDWKSSTFNFFREAGLGYYWREWCCLDATVLSDKLFEEANKLDVFKYVDLRDFHRTSRLYINSFIGVFGTRVDLYEKLIKVGMGDLVREDCRSYAYDEIRYDKTQTELLKMLGITRNDFEFLKKYPSNKSLRLLQKGIETYGVNRYEIYEYIMANGLNVSEYCHYLSLTKQIDGKITRKNAMPTDFRVADNAITERYEICKNALQNETIKKIADGLRKMPELQKFFGGSNGLLVYVPESNVDLQNEGKALHNCLRTYGGRISDGNTLIFYIRQLNNPTAPFVAMEYSHGRIVQCRYNCNKSVYEYEDDESKKIIQFATELASTLREANILAA